MLASKLNQVAQDLVSQAFNVLKDGLSMASLRNLFRHLTTLIVKNFFFSFASSQNFFCCSLLLLQLIIPLCNSANSLIFFFFIIHLQVLEGRNLHSLCSLLTLLQFEQILLPWPVSMCHEVQHPLWPLLDFLQFINNVSCTGVAQNWVWCYSCGLTSA